MSDKTFLLMMPDYSDFPNLFMDNLKKVGFSPYLITDNPSKFKYKGSEKIINFFQKTLSFCFYSKSFFLSFVTPLL